jgi:hypothetical protein
MTCHLSHFLNRRRLGSETMDERLWTPCQSMNSRLQWNRAALDVIHHGLIVQILQDPEMQASYSMWEWKLWNSEIEMTNKRMILTSLKFCSILGNSEVEINLIGNTKKQTESSNQQHNALNEGNCKIIAVDRRSWTHPNWAAKISFGIP